MSTIAEQVAERRLELSAHRHSPTRAMQVVAKRGVRQATGREGIDPMALAVGKRLASGQKLADDHVEQMASYHAAHDGPCASGNDDTSTEDMLWGGAPGASWSSARCAAMDATSLSASDAPRILTLDQEGTGVSLEVFIRDGMGEPTELDQEGDKQLIWAPILRSGMLATRPGPNGEKVDEPLVFVPGRAADPRREIGLENLLDSFQRKAIQHVTIPTSHENDVLSNTGYIVDMRIVDSKKRPGEKVLVAAHDFRDPDVRRKVELGTIANRSCGIVYDYKNTESGEVFEQAVEHVALTNKPWVTGMSAYGEINSDDDFADRRVVPMLLAEAPRRADLATSKTDKSWDGSASRFSDQQYAKACVLDRGTGTVKERYGLPVREPDGTLNSNAVHAAAGRIASVKDATLAQKKAAARKLVALYRTIGEQPPVDLTKVVAASTNMSEAERRSDLLLADVQWGDELSLNEIRSQVLSHLDEMGSPEEYYPVFSIMDVTPTKALVRADYGDPDGADDAWVIPLEADGDTIHLADFSQWTPVEKQWVTDDDAAQDKQELGSLLGGADLPLPTDDTALSRRNQAVLRLSQERPNDQQGGAMTPTTKEVLERLGLSEEQRSVVQKLADDNEKLRKDLGQERKDARKERITQRVQELQGKGFTPGFCKRYEEIALGDDGEVAAVLNLSEEGSSLGQREFTATQLADSLISALPFDDSGKLALADQANLLTSPLSGRPPVDNKDQEKVLEQEGKKPETADEWLAEAEKVAPGITSGIQLAQKKEN